MTLMQVFCSEKKEKERMLHDIQWQLLHNNYTAVSRCPSYYIPPIGFACLLCIKEAVCTDEVYRSDWLCDVT